ncbi:MAG TPA: hypothetical protein DGL25_02840 [Dehalococcoidia bacterium]|nr:hypothetical protein [Dehalococcoidia bacterium]|tara:strand:+ start:398 stop:904 length:507 start_codon:yes stop_codon:yes gene_type:complete
MTLLTDLEKRLTELGGEGVLGFLAERLGDPKAMETELSDTPATIKVAEQEEERSESWMMDAFEKFPIMNAETFPHSSHIDPRAHAVLATHRLAQGSGLYLPSELRAMQEREEVSEAWQAREGLRFCVFTTLMRTMGEAMVDGGVGPADYVSSCQDTAKALGAIEIASP